MADEDLEIDSLKTIHAVHTRKTFEYLFTHTHLKAKVATHLIFDIKVQS